jgi:hypothetical protein
LTVKRSIAAALADAIQTVIPPRFGLHVVAGAIGVSVDGAPEVWISLSDGVSLEHREALLAGNVLSTLQDVIVRETSQPWPTGNSSSDLPLPGTKAVAGMIEMWFGDERSPALRLPSVDLSTVDF